MLDYTNFLSPLNLGLSLTPIPCIRFYETLFSLGWAFPCFLPIYAFSRFFVVLLEFLYFSIVIFGGRCGFSGVFHSLVLG
jgi:hypothetical protein